VKEFCCYNCLFDVKPIIILNEVPVLSKVKAMDCITELPYHHEHSEKSHRFDNVFHSERSEESHHFMKEEILWDYVPQNDKK